MFYEYELLLTSALNVWDAHEHHCVFTHSWE